MKIKKRILCVEDHPDMCELISFILEDYEVVSASTVTEACEKLKNGVFSVVLLDYHLPDGTGEEICSHLRSFDRFTPILFITGTSSFNSRQAQEIGASGSLFKNADNFVDDLRLQVFSLT